MAARMLPPQAEGARSEASVPAGPNPSFGIAIDDAPPAECLERAHDIGLSFAELVLQAEEFWSIRAAS